MAISFGTNSSTGLGEGIDVGTVVDQYITAARAPERQMQAQQATLTAQSTALNTLNASLADLDETAFALKDPFQSFATRTATSSQTSVLTASASSNTATGTHVVTVDKLATIASAYSDSAESATASLQAGSFDVTVGGATTSFSFGTSDTLTSLADMINAKQIGITASVVKDASGARLALVSKISGAAGDITIGNVTGETGFHKGTEGQNASLTVDGVPISSATNSVRGVIPGLTLSLANAAPGTQVTVTIGPDQDKITSKIKTFVENYNAVVTQLNAQFKYDSTSKTSGPLAGDPTAAIVQQKMLHVVQYSSSRSGTITSLRNLGISVENDGTLTLDSAALDAALRAQFADVEAFFMGTETTPGFASSLYSETDGLSNPANGAFYVELRGIAQSQASLQDQIDNFELYIANKQQQLMEQYNRINVMLQQLPLQLKQVQSQLGGTSND